MADDSRLCDEAAARAAQRHGVPAEVLQAIMLTETGRDRAGEFRPWPWAVNQGGEGLWFPGPDEALAHIETQVAAGVTNLDVGCFQLNVRWHGARFSSAADMLDPDQNAAYAAAFLARLRTETGDWPAAAARYHSRTEEHAARYRAKFEAILADLPRVPFDVAADNPGRPNLFPFLQPGARGTAGSLVPRRTAQRPLIGG